MRSTFPLRPSVIIPLLILAIVLVFPQPRNYFLMQLGVSQTKWGYISSIIFESDKNLIFKTPHTYWEKWDQLIATTQGKKEENYADVYIKKHPQKTWLLAERIRCLLNYCSLPRRGELQFMRRDYSPGTPNSKEDDLRRTATTKVLFPRIIVLCHLAKQQEPQNAYYDLILAVVAYSEFRDHDGWRYFQEAASKPVFDAHYIDLLHQQLLITRNMAGRSLTSEEKHGAESVIQLRDLSFYHTLSYWMQWWAAQDIREGKISKAMETMQTMSRLGSLITSQAKLDYVAWTGSTFITQAALTPWKALQKSEYLPGPQHKNMPQEQQYCYVESFAAQHHLPALRQMVTTDLQYRYYRLRATDRANAAKLSIYEMAVPTITWNWCVWMLVFIFGAILSWLTLAVFRKHNVILPRDLRFTATTLSVTATLLPLAVGHYLLLGSEEKLHRNLGPGVFSQNVYDDHVVALLFRVACALFPLLISFLVSGMVVYLFHWRKLKAARSEYPFKRKVKVLLSDAAALLWAFWFPALIALCWAVCEYISDTWDFFYFNPGLIGAIFLLMILAMIIVASYLLWRYIRAPRVDAETEYWKTVYSSIRFSLSGAVLVFAILYGVSMAVTTISRQRAEQRMAPFYRVGEMQVFGDKRDLTLPITADRFFQYQKEWRNRNVSNRIDW